MCLAAFSLLAFPAFASAEEPVRACRATARIDQQLPTAPPFGSLTLPIIQNVLIIAVPGPTVLSGPRPGYAPSDELDFSAYAAPSVFTLVQTTARGWFTIGSGEASLILHDMPEGTIPAFPSVTVSVSLL